LRSWSRHVHLSSPSGGHHVQLAGADELVLANVLDRRRDLPWILAT
jgi:hypothetical protein